MLSKGATQSGLNPRDTRPHLRVGFKGSFVTHLKFCSANLHFVIWEQSFLVASIHSLLDTALSHARGQGCYREQQTLVLAPCEV